MNISVSTKSITVTKREDAYPADILLIEDNPDDVMLTIEAFRESNLSSNLHIVEDGMEAMDFLRRRGSFAGAPSPDLILLDLNLPKKDGREVLREIKTDDGLKHIPVIILTTSQAEHEIFRCYQDHANCYIIKPVDVDQFFQAVQSLDQFWFSVAKLPPVQP